MHHRKPFGCTTVTHTRPPYPHPPTVTHNPTTVTHTPSSIRTLINKNKNKKNATITYSYPRSRKKKKKRTPQPSMMERENGGGERTRAMKTDPLYERKNEGFRERENEGIENWSHPISTENFLKKHPNSFIAVTSAMDGRPIIAVKRKRYRNVAFNSASKLLLLKGRAFNSGSRRLLLKATFL